MRPYLCKGRNVTTDSYFTSLKLAKQLKEKRTSLLGIMNKIRREVPLPLRKMKEKLHSCKLYKCGDTTLTAYQIKVNKHVLILSTMQNDITIAANAKKTLKQFSSTTQQSTESMYLIKWPRNILAETPHEDGQYIVSKMH